eukprot:CAMPEP_0117532882 /NCGR_PEP_ID=MMETSP0784-20121206/39599_1 /TAXON_ID=39447 /ORGANISM="" /LENGTH=642 /DNA_ID=CAMNT_0005329293 /DNA_START=42 /DNA_END=1970 /DNA_ORIENTATION=+
MARAPSWQKALAAFASSYVGWKVVDGKYNVSADLAMLPKLMKFKAVIDFLKTPGAGIPKLWYQTLSKPGQADKVMFIAAEDGRQMTFGEVEALSNRVAHWALSVGLKPGDVVALMMDNRLEYVPVWLGLAKVRVITTLINTSTKGKSLVHAIAVANSSMAIFGTEHATQAAEVADSLRGAGVAKLLSYGAGSPAGLDKPDFCDASFDDVISSQPTTPVDDALRMATKAAEPCLYIYTSGTTGLPKACKLSHIKVMVLTLLGVAFEVMPEDIIYGSGMPLYHSAATIGVTSCINIGCSMVIRAKFSASQQMEECAKYKATAMQYIGELCRYLLAAPPRASDKAHNVRIAFGNGLRPEIWDDFQRRFGVPEIGEFYGATEGNIATFNHCKNYQGQGAIGRAGSLTLKVKPMSIVKFDVDNEVLLRSAQGFCVECEPDEPGELIGLIKKYITADGEVDDFEGYTNDEATEKKIARNVFKKGDAYFRTGDLVRRDRKGYYYFVDRIGDTFRWKGENVSTMEVSEILSSFPGIVDAIVYGVQIPGKDGRACMVAVTMEPETSLDSQRFSTYCRANLPSYAIPVFVRFPSNQINLTGTFKHQKVEYRNEGCDPSKIKDSMLWYNTATSLFEPYGAEQFAQITSGRAKL